MGKMLWSVFIFMLLLSGCGWNGTPTREDDFSPVTSITISAVSSTIANGTSTRLTATGHVSGLGTRDITDKVTWSSDTTTVAVFNPTVFPGRVTGVSAGSAVVTATLGTLSAAYTLTVTPAAISSIAVTPAAPSVPKGLTQPFKAIGTFTDGTTSTTQDITLDVAWNSSDAGIATVSNDENSKGVATAVAIGTSTITAIFGTVSGTAEMTVTKPVVRSIAVSPANPTALSLSTQSFTATGTYSDGSTADITSGVTWSSSDTNLAAIKSSGGLATTLAPGSATISAALDNISGSTALTVTGGSLSSIAVTPATATLAKDTRTRITATGTFSDGSIRDITGAVTWTSASDAFATVTAPGENLAWLNAVAVTSTSGVTITATGVSTATKTGTTTLTVTDPTTLSLLAISSSTLALPAGISSRLSATAAYSSNPTSTDVTYSSTSDCAWKSSDTSVATVGTDGFTKGRVTAVAAGTATITASYGGKTVTSTVTVTSRTLKSLTISGLSSLTAGYQKSYAAKAIYTDSSTEYDVTEDTDWSITPSNVAVLADSVNQPGQIVAVNSGTATLTAKFGGKSTTVTIIVP